MTFRSQSNLSWSTTLTTSRLCWDVGLVISLATSRWWRDVNSVEYFNYFLVARQPLWYCVAHLHDVAWYNSGAEAYSAILRLCIMLSMRRLGLLPWFSIRVTTVWHWKNFCGVLFFFVGSFIDIRCSVARPSAFWRQLWSGAWATMLETLRSGAWSN